MVLGPNHESWITVIMIYPHLLIDPSFQTNWLLNYISEKNIIFTQLTCQKGVSYITLKQTAQGQVNPPGCTTCAHGRDLPPSPTTLQQQVVDQVAWSWLFAETSHALAIICNYSVSTESHLEIIIIMILSVITKTCWG